MGMISLASNASAWRGYTYYSEHKVQKWNKIDENTYQGVVKGSGTAEYQVILNLAHPRKSTCNCPHAEDRHIVCKHMVAVFFAAFPKEAENFLREVEENEQEMQREHEQERENIRKYVYSLSKAELRTALLNYMLNERYDERC